MAEEKKKKKKKSIISNIILVIALGVFLYSAYQLFTIFAEYNKGEKEYDHLMEDVVTEVEVEETDENRENAEPSEDKEQAKKTEHKVLKIDFKKLKATNEEIVGWISFDEPSKINYPIVRTSDNDKYLTQTFEGKKNSSGAIFMDAGNLADFSDRNTFIYGHNMKNGSMFGRLRKYKSESFFREYPFFYIYTPDGKEVKYQVFAVGIVEDIAESFNRYYDSDEDYLTYLKHLQTISLYKTGVEVNAQSQIVSLSTCTNVTDTQRLLVHGVKISEMMVE